MHTPHKDRTHATDAALAKEACDGSGAAFEVLFNRHQLGVVRFVWSLVRNQATAEDIAQDTFLKAFANLRRYNPAKPFKPWLLTIARRTTIDTLRKARPADPLNDTIPDTANGPRDHAETQQAADIVWQTVHHTLPERQASILWLYYADGMAIAEVAAAMRLPQALIKVDLHRARKRLQRVLPPELAQNTQTANTTSPQGSATDQIPAPLRS